MDISENQLTQVLEQYREDHPRSKKDQFFRTLNSILLTIIIALVSTGGAWLKSMDRDTQAELKVINDKMDGLMVATLTNSSAIQSHETTANIWISRIEALEKGTTVATSDRITKTEALAAIENLRAWVEKYYERKE